MTTPTSRSPRAAGHRPDAVYQRYALGSFAGLELARRLQVPLILEFNGSEIWTERQWGSGHVPFAEALGALERRNVHDASLVVVVSQVLKDELVADGVDPDRVLVNPNGVDVDRLADVRALDPAAWRARLGRPEAPTVGFVGTFGLWHGVRRPARRSSMPSAVSATTCAGSSWATARCSTRCAPTSRAAASTTPSS